MVIIILILLSIQIHGSDIQITVETPRHSPAQERSPRLSKEESKEIARKVNNILTASEDTVLEEALSRTLSDDTQVTYKCDIESLRINIFAQLSTIHDELNVDADLKKHLSQWAIKELSERNNHEVAYRKRETRKKVIASTLALIATALSVIGPIATFFIANETNCPHISNSTRFS